MLRTGHRLSPPQGCTTLCCDDEGPPSYHHPTVCPQHDHPRNRHHPLSTLVLGFRLLAISTSTHSRCETIVLLQVLIFIHSNGPLSRAIGGQELVVQPTRAYRSFSYLCLDHLPSRHNLLRLKPTMDLRDIPLLRLFASTCRNLASSLCIVTSPEAARSMRTSLQVKESASSESATEYGESSGATVVSVSQLHPRFSFGELEGPQSFRLI